jgi:peptidyl-prolyl cis-trans isomerase C
LPVLTARRLRALAVVAFTAAALVACGRHGVDTHPPEPGDTAVATLNDETIWASDVKREAVAQGLIGEGEPLDTSSDLFHQVLDEVVDQKLLAAEATKRAIQSEPLARRRLMAARERILGDMLVESVVEKGVTENAIRGLYDEQVKLSKQSQEYHVRQIVAASQADADATRKLLAAGSSFEALAMNRSTDAATRFNGGDLGYMTPDVMPEAYANALKTAKAGQVVGPFQADPGFVLLKVEDVRPEKPISIEEARPQIVRFLTYDQVKDLLEKLRGQNKVKMLIGPAQGGSGAPREPASAPQPAAAAPMPAPTAPAGPSAAERALAPNAGLKPSVSLAPSKAAQDPKASKKP